MKTDPFAVLDEAAHDRLRRTGQPQWTAPMLATLTGEVFSDPGWIFERKLDGERCLVFRRGRGVRLRSRNRRVLNDTYPELEEALLEQETGNFVADGEIVAFEGPVTSFSRLQQRMGLRDREEARRSGVAVHLYLFDLIHAGGRDLSAVPLRDRKKVLKHLLGYGHRIRYTPHRNEHGERYFTEACGKGWEGLIAKRAGGRYRHGRSRDWLKFKCKNRQEFVIGGHTPPRGSRAGFGALLLGYYRDGELQYAGKVGTGFDDDTLERLARRLAGAARKTSPFAGSTGEREARWVTPRFVAEIAFTEWTRDGRLRHPRFLGLRRDKNPSDVVRERPAGSG